MFKFFKYLNDKLLNWCLSNKKIQIGDLYNSEKDIKINRFDNNELKFISEINLKDKFVKTPSGFRNVKKVLKTIEYDVYHIILENGLFIYSADKHILIDEFDNEIFSIDSLGCNIKTVLGISKVVDVIKINNREHMYDLEIEGNGHTYYTNGILSHNSQTAAAYMLWYAMFHSQKTCLLASDKNANAIELIYRIQIMYENCPHWLIPGITADGFNVHSVKFDNRSRILSAATTEKTGRGMSISKLFVDELAFVGYNRKNDVAREFWASISPTLSTGGSCIISSTPNTDIDLFSEIWRGAEQETNGFVSLKAIWDEDKSRNDDWKKAEIGRIGIERFQREHECLFLGNDSLLIDGMSLARLKEEPPINELKDFKFWAEFEKEKTYIVGMDPSTGVGNDYTVIEVFEFPEMVQIAEFRSNVSSPTVSYSALKALLRLMEQKESNIHFSVENNSVGEAIIALLETDENGPEDANFISGSGKRPGFNTNSRTKIKSCLKFKELLERDSLQIKSKVLISECKHYSRSAGSYEAKAGGTDDCIAALLICIRILEEIVLYDDEAYSLMNSSLEDDYFSDTYNENSIDDAPLPIIF